MLERSLRILVAEPHPLVLSTMIHMLENAGFIVDGARDGDSAVGRLLASDRPIDLLITDTRLGMGIDGWALAEHGRRIDPRLGVLYVSGDCGGQLQAQGVVGAPMLVKPLHRNDLLSAIDKLGLGAHEPAAATVALL